LTYAQPSEILNLTPAEKEYIKQHPVLKVGADRAWAPIEYQADDGNYYGLAMDYMNIVSRLLDIKMDVVRGLAWPDVLSNLQAGELDVLSAVDNSPERQKYMLFTRYYISLPAVCFTRQDHGFIAGIDTLKGQRIGMVKDYAVTGIMKKEHPELSLVETESVKDSLIKLHRGELDVFIGNLMTGSYYIRELGYYSDMKVAGETPYHFNLSLGTRKDNQLLSGILDKALATISNETHFKLQSKWTAVTYEKDIDYSLVWEICIGLGAIMLVVLYWNRRLAKEVMQRRVAEQLLRSSEATLSRAQKIAKLGSWRLDIIRNVIERSLEAYQVYGRTPDELSQNIEDFLSIVVPEDKSRVSNVIQDAKNGRTFSIEYSLFMPDGMVRTVFERGEPEYDEAGQLIAINGTVFDVTERVLAEQAIRSSEEKARVLMNSTPDFFVLCNADGIIVDCNSAFVKFRGVARSKLIGQYLFDFYIGKDREQKRRLFMKVVDTFQPVHFEDAMGNVFLSTILSPIKDDAGHVSMVGIYSRNLTEYKKIQNALKDSEEQLRVTLASIGDGVIATDANSNVILMNSVAENLTGWKFDDALGKPLTAVFQILSGHTRLPIVNPVGDVLATGRIRQLANGILLISRDGREYQISDSAAPIRDENGNIRGVVLNFRNMTLEYQRRKILQRTQFSIDHAPLEIYLLDKDGRYVYANNLAKANFGLTDTSITGTTIFDINPGIDRQWWEKLKRDVMLQGVVHCESTHRTADGHTYPVDVRYYRVNLDDVDYLCIFAIDISSKKQAEEQRQMILEAAGDGIFGVDAFGNIIFMNPAAYKLFGYEDDELVGRPLKEILCSNDSEDSAYVMELCPMVLAYTCGIESHIDDEMLPRKDGSRFPAEYIARPLKRKNEIIGAVVTLRDMTEKKKTESALRASEEQYRSLFESSRDAVIIMDEAGTFLNANDSAVKLFGYRTISELQGLNPMDTSPKTQPEGLASETLAKIRFKQALNEGGSFFEWQHKRKDGSEFLGEVSLNPVMYRGHRAMQAVLRDITARKEMEQKLRQSLSEIESIFENSAVGILYLSGTERKIQRANKRFLELLGYEENEVLGQSVIMFHVSKAKFKEFGKYYKENFIKGEMVRTEIPLKRKDGTVIQCIISGKAIDPPDLSKGVIWIVDLSSLIEQGNCK